MDRTARTSRTAMVRAQRGSVSTELVIVTPVLLLLVMVVVQFALWEHAQHIAEAAAQRGAETARVENGSDAQGAATARAAVTELGGSLLVDATVSVVRNGDIVTATVSGSAEGLVPFLSLPVRATAVGPVEHFVAPAAGGP